MKAEVGVAPGSVAGTIRDYVALTKPRIIVLLLVTTWAAMLVAARQAPPAGLTLLTMLGGALSAGSANTLNMYLERDRDQLMDRTRNRPLPSGRLAPVNALVFGIVLGVLSFVILAVGVNLVAALLATAGLLSYVFMYTWWLKPRSVHNTLAGGIAGAMPPLVGWAAITGRVDLAAVFLFAIVFFWELPHTWALATLRLDDYARAGFPMMPVVAGLPSTRRQSMFYSIIMVASSLGLYFTGTLGWLYLAAAVLLGGGFLYSAWRYLRDEGMGAAKLLFRYSTLYLAFLFFAMVVDAVLPTT